jgi:2-C-methyl-D-erythritol 4-phosphate cytidylyltransferase
VAGGTERSHSVRAALAAAGADGDPVIVHDAARPLATASLFDQALDALARAPEADAVIAAAPVTDTIKEIGDDGRSVARTLVRSRLWAVQTPQVFRRRALERALAMGDELLARATDDAWLIEQDGGIVHVLGSDPANLKVTTPHDLRVAELLLAEREAGTNG